jgi:hypothetical protein
MIQQDSVDWNMQSFESAGWTHHGGICDRCWNLLLEIESPSWATMTGYAEARADGTALKARLSFTWQASCTGYLWMGAIPAVCAVLQEESVYVDICEKASPSVASDSPATSNTGAS